MLARISISEFESALRELEASGDLPNRGGELLRTPLAAMLGLPQQALCNTDAVFQNYSKHRSVLSEFEQKWKQRELESLKRTLKDTYAAGSLPIGRGKVSRLKLERQLGLPINSTTGGRFKSSVDEFNEWLRTVEGRGLVWEERTPKIREHLEKLQTEGELPRNARGLLNRSEVLRPFGATAPRVHTIVSGCEPLANLLAEYDELLEKDAELFRYKYTALSGSLKALLEREDMPLTHGKLVPLTWLADQLQVSVVALKRAPALQDLLQKAQESIDRRLATGKTKKYFVLAGVRHKNRGSTPYSAPHKRVFAFEEMARTFSLLFAEWIGTAFHLFAERFVSASNNYHDVLEFLSWISDNRADYSSVHRSLSNGMRPDTAEFESMFLRFRSTIQARSLDARNEGKTSPWSNYSYSAIVGIADLGVFPAVRHLIKREKLVNRGDVRAKPSLAEAATIENILIDAAISRAITFDRGKDTLAFSETLVRERRERKDLPDDLVESILALSEERIDEIRRICSLAIEGGIALISSGEQLQLQSSHTGEEIFNEIGLSKGRTSERRAATKKFFPLGNPVVAQANLLRLIADRYGRLCPDSLCYEGYFASQYLKAGGSQTLQSMLSPTRRVVSAGVLLYLVESGANCSVGATVSRGPYCRSPLEGHKRVTGYKVRAEKNIVDDLPCRHRDGSISAIDALEFLAKVTPRLEAHPEVLATYAIGGETRHLSQAGLRVDMKQLLSHSEKLRTYNITPSMLRPTKLLVVQLRNPADRSVAQRIAEHQDWRTTIGYTNKLPFRQILERKALEFSNHVQVLIADEAVDKPWVHFGATKLDWRESIMKAKRTGLGVYCRDPFDSPQPDVAKGIKCLKLDRCIECRQRVVIADPESIADMILWREGLVRAEKVWLESRIEQWEKTWLPWLAFFQVVLDEKMATGRLRAVRGEAERLALKRKASTNFRLPEPW